jgi:hypothetical protein
MKERRPVSPVISALIIKSWEEIVIYLQKISDFKTSEIIQEEKPVKTTQGKLHSTSC